MKLLLTFLVLVSSTLNECTLKSPSATITDEYIQARNVGQYLRITELDSVKIDSSFEYPSQEKAITSYLLSSRDTKKEVEGNVSIKIYFLIRNPKYVWKVYRNFFSAEYNYQDTINIKPFKWYKLTTEKSGFYSYFYWNGKKGDYALRLKPKPGAY